MKKRLIHALAFAVPLCGWGQSGFADQSDMLKSGEIWRHCEHYYLSVEKYQADNDHYAIRDVSLEFLKSIKRFTPRTRSEAFLYVECVNLGNGNATQAHDAILREEAEDDEFFSLAVTDATNNSNASQYEYTRDLDGKHQLVLEADVASENFRSILAEERVETLGVATLILGEIGIALTQAANLYVGNDFGFYNYNSYQGSPQGWTQFTNNVSQTHSQNSSGTAGLSASGHGATLAPLTPTSPSGGSSTGGSWAPPPGQGSSGNSSAGGASSSAEQVAAKPAESPAGALLETAKHLDDSCIDYRMANDDDALAVVENRCDTPVVFYWCWIPKGGSTCAPSLISNVIAPGSSDRVHGPNENEQQIAEYVVCDMSNRQHICLK